MHSKSIFPLVGTLCFFLVISVQAKNQANPEFVLQKGPTQSFVWSDKDEDLSHQHKYLLAQKYQNEPAKRHLAVKYLTDSARMGYDQAQYDLGMKYYRGELFAKNLTKARKWFEKAAAQEHLKSMFQLALMLQKGEGGSRDPKRAVHFLTVASENGLGEAQHALAIIYLKQGNAKNIDSAIFWLRKAVQQENSDAKRDLGFLYIDGVGVEKNYRQAQQLLTEPAQQGNPMSQFLLGEIYSRGGYGVEKRTKQARHWYQAALQSGYMDAKIGIQKLNGQASGLTRSFVPSTSTEKRYKSNNKSSRKKSTKKTQNSRSRLSQQKANSNLKVTDTKGTDREEPLVQFNKAWVFAWKKAWQNKDFNRYRGFYSRYFKNHKNNYQSWIRYRKKIIEKSNNIHIKISNLSVKPHKKKQVLVTFQQIYQSESYSDKVIKTQYWRQDRDLKWRIVFEGSQPL